jgi:protein involved in polysaccharide export with SLBB domain
LQAEDTIEVYVSNHPDLSGKSFRILSDGTFTFPEAGEVKAAGKTAKEIASVIKGALSRTRNNVDVTVSVRELRPIRARIVGAVRLPSAYDVKKGWRLLDLVAVAGGLAAKPNHISGRMIRAGAKVVPLDMARAMADPASEANPLVEAEDLVLLDALDPPKLQVYVTGQVEKSGAFELLESTTMLGLLSQAGGPTKSAALSRAYVLRRGKEMPLDLRSVLVQGKSESSVTGFALENGDVLFLPALEQRFAVMGHVLRPGYYSLPEKEELRLLDAVGLAGVELEKSDLRRAGIIRLVNGKPSVLPADIEKLLKRGDLASNVAMQPNDILYIPSRTQKGFTFTDLMSPLSALALMGLRIF